MTKIFLVRPAAVLMAVVAAAACGGSGSTPSTTPAPAQAPAPAASAPAASSSIGNMNMSGGGRLPAGVTAAMVAQGDSIFHAGSCQRCHGMDAKGTTRAPNLTTGTYQHGSGSFDDIVKVITSGVTVAQMKDPSHTFAMRARGGIQPPLTDDQVKAVAAYVYTLGHK